MLMIKNGNLIALIVGFTALCLIFTPDVFGSTITPLDTQFNLKVGETANVDSGFQITLLDVIDDSRCPSDVTCIWQGTVSIKVKIIKDGQDWGDYIVPFESTDAPKIFNDHFITLIEVSPYPLSSHKITSSEYVATMSVSKVKNNNIESPLKQFKSGIPSDEITCRQGLELVIKSSNSSPACVKPNTSEQLFSRGWTTDEPSSIDPIIKTGTNTWHCVGYCFKEFTITSKKIVYSQNGRESISGEWSDLPEKTKETSISKAIWDNLANLVDFQQFNSLPDKIGCPGCADAPIEWIEISYGDKTKKIEFEYGDEIPEITKLITTLQEIRNTVELSINSFEECVSAGNAVMESYPRQCKTDDGKFFVEEINSRMMSPESLCQKYGGKWIQEFNECDTILTLDNFKKTLVETQDIDLIFQKFGKPHDDIGSGIHIYVYNLNNGSQIWIGYADKIIYVRNMDHNGNLIKDLDVPSNTKN